VSATTAVKSAARSPWVERAARLGFVAKGAVYAIVGLLAIQIPLGLGGATTDRQGALRTVAQQPFGEVLLLLLAAGLAGYALWRLAQAFADRDGEGTSPKGLAKRAGSLGRAVVYGSGALAAFALVAGWGSGGGSNEQQETAMVLGWPAGPWLVGAAGAGFLVAGAFNVYRSFTGKFRKDLKESQMARAAQPWAIAVGVVGHAARGAVFALIGLFLVRAAVQYDPRETIGLDGALRKLAEQPYGGLLLGLVAAGLLAYALFCFVAARYRAV
jgi:hypothetical protein